MKLIKSIDRRLFGNLEGQFERALHQEIGGSCDSLLDVGCGFNSPVGALPIRPKRCVGIDAFQPVIDISRNKGIHDEYHKMDVRNILEKFGPKSFDVVIACDLIEHLIKSDGLALLGAMEKVARKKVIVYTPNGYLEQREEYGNPLQAHLSGWTVSDFASRGYRVVGIEGLMWLRGEMARIKWRPHRFWRRVSLASQLITTAIPSLSFRLFAVRDIRNGI